MTGAIYVYTEFKVIGMLLPEDVVALNPVGYQTSSHWYPACARHKIIFSHIGMMWYDVLKIGSRLHLQFRRYSNLSFML